MIPKNVTPARAQVLIPLRHTKEEQIMNVSKKGPPY